MGEHPLVGGVTIHGHRGEQAALEPAAVLVAAFEIQISGVVQPRAATGSCAWRTRPVCLTEPAQHAGPGGAGIKPHVHGVGALAPLIGFGGVGLRQQTGLIALPPHIGAVCGDQPLDVVKGGLVEQHRTGFPMIKNRDRHAPGALAADAPVASLAHHRLDAVATAGGQPLHSRDRLEGGGAKAFDRGKPLLGGAEDRGLFGAPVVGVAVLVAFLLEQQTRGLQGGNDRGVGVFQHVGAGEGAGFGGEIAGLIHRAEHRKTRLFAGVEVVDAVAGGGVDQPGARFGGDVIPADHDRAGALQQGMAVDDAFEIGALHAQQRREREPQAGFQALAQLGGHHQVAGGRGCPLTAGGHGADGVVEPPIHRYRQVGRQGPGGGGPDRHGQATRTRGGGGR